MFNTSPAGAGVVNEGQELNVFLNGLVPFNSVTEEWSASIRFNLIHRPRSDVYLVYNDLRDERGVVQDRAFIAKYTYMFAF